MALGIYEEEDIRAIAKSIRNNLGDDTKYTTEQMPDAINEMQVYAYNSGHSEGYDEGRNDGYTEGKTDGLAEGIEQGKQSESEAFWEGFTDGGKRTSFSSAFAYWGNEYIRPTRKIIPATSTGAAQTFNKCTRLRKVEADYFDFSQKPRGTQASQGWYYTFFISTKIEEIEDIGIKADFGFYNTFSDCYALHTIAKLGCDENTKFAAAFNQCQRLKNITIDGVIGQDGFNVQHSTLLTHDSLMSIINALKDNSGTSTWNTITLGATNLAKLSSEELEIMDLKQWNYN